MSKEIVLVGRAFINTLTLNFVQGSCIDYPAECLVNSANERLEHGGGIAAEIARLAGPDFVSECRRKIQTSGEIIPGQVLVTDSHKLQKFKKIIHAVGPKGEDDPFKSNMLISTLVNSFKAADSFGCKSISVPALSVGIFGYPKDISAQRHFEAVFVFAQQLEVFGTLKEITVCSFTDEETRIFAEEFVKCSELFPVFEYFGTKLEQGAVIGWGLCRICITVLEDKQFEFVNFTCRCMAMCDYCVGEKNYMECCECNKRLDGKVLGYSRCRKCNLVFSKTVYHTC